MRLTPITPASVLSRRPRRAGFALLITVVLVAFLVLIVVALASLTRVETQVAANSAELAKARQNALFALNIALGQLQQAAGPDQRVTATAEIDPTAVVTNRRWTGVWDSDPDSDTYGERLAWLVSGNTPDVTTAPADPDASSDTVRLVGEASADLSTTAASDQNRVDVPLQDIRSDAVPGLAAITGGHRVGRFGYWVGDEGVKARANLTSPLRAPWFTPDGTKTAPDLADQLNDIGLAQRNAIEWMRADTTGDELLEPLLPDDARPEFSRWLTRDQLALSAADSAGATSLANAARVRFHDMTYWSSGVQADVRNGGLKRDLTAAFELPETEFEASVFANGAPTAARAPMAGASGKFVSFIYNEPVSGGTYRGPTWHLLRNHYRLYKEVTDLGALPSFRARALLPTYRQGLNDSILDLYNRTATGDPKILDTISKGGVSRPTPRPTAPALLPVFNRFSFVISLQTVPASSVPDTADPAADIYEVRVVVTPMVVFHNPYNVRLELHDFDGDGYWARLEPRGLPFGQLIRANRNGVIHDFTRRDPAGSPMHNRTVALGAAAQNADPSKGYQSFPQILIPEMVLEPGEVRVFSPSETEPTNIIASTDLEFTANKNIQGGYYFDHLNGVKYDFWGTMAPHNWPIGPAGATVVNTEDNRILVTGDTELSLAVSGLTYTGGNNNFILRFYPETGEGDRTGTRGATEVAMHSEFYVMPPNLGGSSAKDLAEREYTSYEAWTDSGAFNGGETAAAYNSEPRPLFSYDIYVKPSDHSASSGSTPFERASRPFITTNPLAVVTQTEALGDYPSESFRRGYPSAIAAWQPEYRRLNGSWTTDVIDADPSGTAYWGPSNEAGVGFANISLLEVPVRPLTSIAQFQHLMISLYGHEPYMAIGNSESNPFVPPDQATPRNVSNNPANPWYFADTAYLANQALWDGTFFSTLAPGFDGTAYYAGDDETEPNSRESVRDAWLTSSRALPNARVQPYLSPEVSEADRQAALLDPVRAAAHLLVSGSFNINSRSIDAWIALLAGARDAAVLRTDGSTSAVSGAVAIPHAQPSLGDERGTGVQDVWNGFAEFDDAEIAELAAKLVEQITLRQTANGRPFLSLAEFINRALTDDDLGRRGALQSAIDAADLNSAIPGVDIDETVQAEFPFPENGIGNSASVASGYLKQADILQQIGPFLSARSDTFTIRTYGDVIDPLNSTSANPVVISRAWCEAVVQRVPDYVGGEPAETAPADLTPAGESDNFGRRFKVVSFRWLNPEDV